MLTFLTYSERTGSSISMHDTLATPCCKSPVAIYQYSVGQKYGQPGPPCTNYKLCAIILPNNSKVPERIVELLYVGITLSKGP